MRAVLFLCAMLAMLPPMNGQTVNSHAAPSLSEIEAEIENGGAKQALERLANKPATGRGAADVERLRGMAYYQQGQLAQAEQAFAQAGALDPKHIDALQMQGVALYRLGRPEEAIPLLERAHAEFPQVNVDANYVLGSCYILTYRYDDARRAFAAEYGFDAGSPEAYLLLARFLLRHEGPMPRRLWSKWLSLGLQTFRSPTS